MKLNPGRFDNLINNYAQSFLWRKSFACPCVNSSSGQAKTNCPNCSGKGRLWDAGVVGFAGIIGTESAKKTAAFGMWDAGDFMMSIPSDSPLYDIGEFDRVLSLNRTEAFSMNFVYGVNDVMKFTPISIDRVFWIVDDVIIEGNIPDINSAGELVWSGISPPEKATYSMTGRRYPEYYCYPELVLDRPHHQGRKLPRRVLMRRFDLFNN